MQCAVCIIYRSVVSMQYAASVYSMQYELYNMTKGSHPKKNLLLFGFFQFRLDPPPRCFLESFEELFSKPNFIRTKVPQSVWTLVIPQI